MSERKFFVESGLTAKELHERWGGDSEPRFVCVAWARDESEYAVKAAVARERARHEGERRCWDDQRAKDIGILAAKDAEIARLRGEVERVRVEFAEKGYAFAGTVQNGCAQGNPWEWREWADSPQKFVAMVVRSARFAAPATPPAPALAAAEREASEACVRAVRTWYPKAIESAEHESKFMEPFMGAAIKALRALDALRAAPAGKGEEERVVEEAMESIDVPEFTKTERVVRMLYRAGLLRRKGGEDAT